MNSLISATKSEFRAACGNLSKALSTTPDERLHWSPSPTSRTPLQLAAHATVAISGLQGVFDGGSMPFATPADADPGFRQMEAAFKTRAEVEALLAANMEAYERWLDELPASRLNEMIKLPFGFGEAPLSAVIGFPSEHTHFHAAQIFYVQTVYGDRTWY